MSERDLRPLDRDMRALLDRASREIAAPAQARERVVRRIEAIVTPPNGGGGWSLPRSMAAMAATFLLGGALSAAALYEAIHAKNPPGEPRVVYVDRSIRATPEPSPPLEPSPTANVSAPVTASPPSRAALPEPSRSPRSSAPSLSVSSTDTLGRLQAERALLDAARAALEQENGATALAAAEKHQRKYPSGVLVQEREAIAIRALMLLGRTSEARVRAGAFRARFPESALLPTLDSIVAAARAP